MDVMFGDYAGLCYFRVADTQTEAPKRREGATDLDRRESFINRRKGGEEELALARFGQGRVES